MDTINWQGSRNPFKVSMEESVENGLGILTFTRNALKAHILDPDPGYNVIFLETDTIYKDILDKLGIKGSAESGKTANTENVEITFVNMKPNLDIFDDATRAAGVGKGTLTYKIVWGPTRDRFYLGSYEERMAALLALAKAMHAFPALAAAEALVTAYYNTIKTGRETQQGLITNFKTDGVNVAVVMEKAIIQMDRNLGWLKFKYALLPEPQAQVNAFFDLPKIITHNDKVYPTTVSKADFAKVCLHTFKPTDKVIIEVDGPEDVYVCLKEDGKNPCGTGSYRGVAGKKVTLNVMEVFPDLTGRQVIGTNTSMVQATHLIFTIIEA